MRVSMMRVTFEGSILNNTKVVKSYPHYPHHIFPPAFFAFSATGPGQ